MNKSIRGKRAFTLMELILVIILVSLSYIFIFSSKPFSIEKKKDSFSLKTLKEFLIKNYEYENELEFICVDDSFNCYIKVDGKLDEENFLKKVFLNKPEVYEYNKNEIRIDYESQRINDVDYDVVFKYKINNNFKNEEVILDTLEDKLYVYNAIYKKALVFESMDKIIENFENKEVEVKDAF